MKEEIQNPIETNVNPLNNSFWSAARRDWDLDDFIGHGRTEQEAIQDLIDQEADARD